MSASNNPTFAPLSAKARARLADTVDFPTPQFPELTRIMFLMFSRWLFDELVTVEVIWRSTSISLSTKWAIAFVQVRSSKDLSGHAGLVTTKSNFILLGVISIF